MEENHDNNNALYQNMLQLDSFYKSAALLFQTAREMLIQNFNYIDVRDSRLAYTYSSAIRRPQEWLPQYLCIYLKHQKKDEYIALTIMLKNPYIPDNKPLEIFYLYGFKIVSKGETRIDRICRLAIINPDQSGIQYSDMGRYTDVKFVDKGHQCKMVKTNLWEIDNVEKLDRFLKLAVSL